MKRVRDPHVLTDMTGDVTTAITEEQKAAVRLLICGHANGRTKKARVEDAELLMHALGVHPDDIDDGFLMIHQLPKTTHST